MEKEIEGLQESEAKLSEYDLNYLRLRYEAKLAEIALEEAQNAKSQVRMSRDNEGNYSYVYTADENTVNDAAENYRNKIYEMEKANEEYLDTLQQQLLDTQDRMKEDLAKAWEIANGDIDIFAAKAIEIQQKYEQQASDIQQQMQNVFTNAQVLRDEEIVNYVAFTGDIAAQNVDLQTNFGDTFLGIETGINDLQTYFDEIWIPALQTTFNNVKAETISYRETTEEIMENAGTTVDSFRDTATSGINDVSAETSRLSQETALYGATAVDSFARAAEAWQTGPGALLDAINAQAEAVASLAQQYINLKAQLDAVAQAARDMAAAMNQRVNRASAVPTPPSGGGGSGSGSGGNYNNGLKSFIGNTGVTGEIGHEANVERVQQWINHDWLEKKSEEEYRRLELERLRIRSMPLATTFRRLRGFASGGYTGEWGDDGRLAVLHEKELVLNAKDTANILNAVDVVRQLANVIDMNSLAASFNPKISSTASAFGTLEQKVEITANFPNATDRNEIEQAFHNIVNMASQYANYKE